MTPETQTILHWLLKTLKYTDCGTYFIHYRVMSIVFLNLFSMVTH